MLDLADKIGKVPKGLKESQIKKALIQTHYSKGKMKTNQEKSIIT